MDGEQRPLLGMRILIADDSAANLRLLRDVLTLEGAAVRTAPSGVDAVLAAGADLPDLIVLDLQMPDMDGLEVTRTLKADPRTRRIPIIALTAAAMREDEQRAREAGCDGFIPKPFDFGRILGRIRELLPEGRMR